MNYSQLIVKIEKLNNFNLLIVQFFSFQMESYIEKILYFMVV